MGEISDIGCEPRPNIICLEGNGSRPSHKGCGYSVGGAMYTLNSTEVHAVAYANYKADGGIGGGIAFAIVGDHENRPTDMTNLVVLYERTNSIGVNTEPRNDNK